MSVFKEILKAFKRCMTYMHSSWKRCKYLTLCLWWHCLFFFLLERTTQKLAATTATDLSGYTYTQKTVMKGLLQFLCMSSWSAGLLVHFSTWGVLFFNCKDGNGVSLDSQEHYCSLHNPWFPSAKYCLGVSCLPWAMKTAGLAWEVCVSEEIYQKCTLFYLPVFAEKQFSRNEKVLKVLNSSLQTVTLQLVYTETVTEQSG